MLVNNRKKYLGNTPIHPQITKRQGCFSISTDVDTWATHIQRNIKQKFVIASKNLYFYIFIFKFWAFSGEEWCITRWWADLPVLEGLVRPARLALCSKFKRMFFLSIFIWNCPQAIDRLPATMFYIILYIFFHSWRNCLLHLVATWHL